MDGVREVALFSVSMSTVGGILQGPTESEHVAQAYAFIILSLTKKKVERHRGILSDQSKIHNFC